MLSFDYLDKVVFVTGAGRGLGFAICQAFQRAGATIIVNDRTVDQVETAIKRLGGDAALAAPGDPAAAGSIETVVGVARRLGRLDVLVNYAVNVERSVEQTDDDHWDSHLYRRIEGTSFMARAALPLLAQPCPTSAAQRSQLSELYRKSETNHLHQPMIS